MSMLEVFSTSGLESRRKVDFWNHAVATTFADQAPYPVLMTDPVDPVSFSGRLKHVELGALRLAEVCGGPSTVTRGSARRAGGSLMLQLVLAGDVVCLDGGTEHTLRPGDFWLHPLSSACKTVFCGQTTLLAVRIPRTEFLRYSSSPESLLALVIRGSSGPGALVSTYLRQLWTEAEDGALLDLAPRFADIALQMIVSAYCGVSSTMLDESCLVTRHRIQIKAHIERHLRDPELTPTAIAAALGITPGYLHRLFSDGSEGTSESVRRYIVRRRLEECHRALLDRMQWAHSVTAIALGNGFTSVAHFCRIFRERYGMTPGELQHLSARKIS